jgi:hypothetical protein
VLLDQRKQNELQWLQNPSQTNGNNLNHVRRETNTNFRNKNREYMKEVSELKSNSKNKTMRDLYRVMIDLRRDTNLELT